MGIVLGSIGLAFLLRRIFDVPFPDFLPGHLEGFLLLGVGGLVSIAALVGLYRTLNRLMLNPQRLDAIADTLYNRWSRGRGPKIVAIGGGTGLSVLLRGLRAHTDNLTAVITVGDDGGSSGRLRREMGVVPPGDFRNCLVAMSDDDSLLPELFQYRFERGNGLKGHSFGNLFIIALTDVADSFEEALVESSRVLAVQGRVVPAATGSVEVVARFSDGSVVRGESKVGAQDGGAIEQLMIHPETAEAHPLAVELIEDADVVVIGPGSLYTSILPNLLIRGISNAIRRTRGTVVYVCNVATEKGETMGYTVGDHLEVLRRHIDKRLVDYIVVNDRPVDLGPPFLGHPVVHDGSSLGDVEVLSADLVDDRHPVRHDSAKLADAIMSIQEAGLGDDRESLIAVE